MLHYDKHWSQHEDIIPEEWQRVIHGWKIVTRIKHRCNYHRLQSPDPPVRYPECCILQLLGHKHERHCPSSSILWAKLTGAGLYIILREQYACGVLLHCRLRVQPQAPPRHGIIPNMGLLVGNGGQVDRKDRSPQVGHIEWICQVSRRLSTMLGGVYMATKAV